VRLVPKVDEVTVCRLCDCKLVGLNEVQLHKGSKACRKAQTRLGVEALLAQRRVFDTLDAPQSPSPSSVSSSSSSSASSGSRQPNSLIDLRPDSDEDPDDAPSAFNLRFSVAMPHSSAPPPHWSKSKRFGEADNPGPLTDRLSALRFKYYGNWGGPNYSGGQFSSQPDWSVPSIDALDETFKRHDYNYTRMPQHLADKLWLQQASRLPITAKNVLFASPAMAGFHLKSQLSSPGNWRDVPDPGGYPWEFDPTLGYPGEGPPKSKKRSTKRGPKPKLQALLQQNRAKSATKKFRINGKGVTFQKGKKRAAKMTKPTSIGRAMAAAAAVVQPKIKTFQQVSTRTTMKGRSCLGVVRTFNTPMLTTGPVKYGPLLVQDNFPLHPSAIAAVSNMSALPSRPSKMADLYEKYSIKKWQVSYVSDGKMDQRGRFAVFFDYDPADKNEFAFYDQEMEQVCLDHFAEECTLNSPHCVFRPDPKKIKKTYWCRQPANGDDHFYMPARMFIVSLTKLEDINFTANTEPGIFYLDWEVEYLVPVQDEVRATTFTSFQWDTVDEKDTYPLFHDLLYSPPKPSNVKVQLFPIVPPNTQITSVYGAAHSPIAVPCQVGVCLNTDFRLYRPQVFKIEIDLPVKGYGTNADFFTFTGMTLNGVDVTELCLIDLPDLLATEMIPTTTTAVGQVVTHTVFAYVPPDTPCSNGSVTTGAWVWINLQRYGAGTSSFTNKASFLRVDEVANFSILNDYFTPPPLSKRLIPELMEPGHVFEESKEDDIVSVEQAEPISRPSLAAGASAPVGPKKVSKLGLASLFEA
jgi:hypothetical protein